MSKLAKAESALVSKLEISRNNNQTVQKKSTITAAGAPGGLGSPPTTQLQQQKSNSNKTTKSHHSNENPEIKEVLDLEDPRYNPNKIFYSLEKQKIQKKDRHMNALDEFHKNLEIYAEEIEVNVLNLSRNVRDDLEKVDHIIQTTCASWKIDENLVLMSSEELSEAKIRLQQILFERLQHLDNFAQELEQIECNRALNIGNKIKELVDQLIGIAHQLPDEIEHIVEIEAYDLNTVITKNRQSHLELLGIMRTKHIEIDIIALHEWDVAKLHWRKLRHDQAIQIFHRDIRSPSYTEPKDRQEFMRNIRLGQESRQATREEALLELSKLHSENISTAAIVTPQQILQQVNDEELNATQECYNGLSELRVKLQKKAENRMEELRIELHRYGALCEEPPLQEISNQLKVALNSPELSELWRVGGGLKPDILSVATDFTSQNIFYESFLKSVQDRVEVLVCGFNLKEVLNERGRLPRLDVVKNLLSKTRTVPRTEVAAVLTTLLPDLKEMSLLEKMPHTFQFSLLQCIDGMEKELQRLSQESEMNGSISSTSILAAPLSSATASGTANLKTSTTNLKKTATITPNESSATLKSGRKTTARTLKNSTLLDADKSVAVVDPGLVKQWTRVLGILYYGSDLPQIYQQELYRALAATKQQKLCNEHVDIAVRNECDRELDRLDLRYKRLLDSIVTFLELQTSSLTISCTQIVDFYLKTANLMEKHKETQNKLDETSLDALWDYKEDNRLACEERESNFQEACKILQRSPDMVELQKNFEEVLHQLEIILDNYRIYHGKACFIADQYPVSLADDFSHHMKNLCSLFKMEAITPHRILEQQERLNELNQRLNRKYLEKSSSEDNGEGGEGEGGGGGGGTEETTPGNGKRENSTEPSPPKDYPETFYLEEIIPHQQEAEEEDFDDEELERDPAPHRKYGLLITFQQFVQNFLEDSSLLSREEDEETPNLPKILPSMSSDVIEGDTTSGRIGPGISEKINPSYPWLIMKIFPGQEEPPMVTLLDETTLTKMEPDEIEVHEETVAKYFVPQDEESLVKLIQAAETRAATTAAATVATTEEKGEVQIDLKEAYEQTLAIVERVNQRKQEKSSKYLRENPPKDSKGSPFVSKMDISFDSLSTMLHDLKISLISHLERTASLRIEEAEILTTKRKHELTEELEDLLRTHWPRSGLVETQIKRPREVELLNHEEKTYRFIISIQEKMAALQNRFEDEVHMAELCCEEYRKDIHQLTEQLSSVQYKTLASLQGVEVKARSITQSFTATGNNYLTKLRQIVAEDASSVIIYAKDFRKICPPQEEGKDGGYSPAELEEIGLLVEGQCKEIEELLTEWRESINKIDQLFSITATDHGIFTNKYDQVANDLALSQGLGQKYGAPRRRAQERLRTEMSRDEQCAGKVDELIALLEFSCAEAVRKCDTIQCTPSLISFLLQGKDPSTFRASGGGAGGGAGGGGGARGEATGGKDLGYEELQAVDAMWELSLKVRQSLYDRAVYLSVLADPSEDTPTPIPWPGVLSHFPSSATSPSSHQFDSSLVPINSTQRLSEIVDDVEKTCIQETKDLYTKEGKGELLKETSEGIPESLSLWLRETRHKILGPKGHHEKSWKRLWNQIDTFETLFGRKSGPMDQPQTKVGVPAACFRILGYGYEQFLSQNIDQRVEQFIKILKLFEKGKEKHERQLRPRLGSPDALPELLQLDSIEMERSNDLRQNAEKFQSQILTHLSNYSKVYCEDLSVCATAFIRYLDSSLRLDLIQVPPDTEIPKKKMTLKRLRKVQRIQEAVKNGAEDSSAERVWPSLPLDSILQGLTKAEPLILLDDLQSIAPLAPPPPVDLPTTTPGKATKGKKKTEPEPAPIVPQSSRPELIPESWIQSIREKSSVRGEVSTAHRLLVSERDNSLQRLSSHLTSQIDENKVYFGKILQQEDSWNERWRTQVEMLKQGNL